MGTGSAGPGFGFWLTGKLGCAWHRCMGGAWHRCTVLAGLEGAWPIIIGKSRFLREKAVFWGIKQSL